MVQKGEDKVSSIGQDAFSITSLFYVQLLLFTFVRVQNLWFLTHTVYGQSIKETIQGLKAEILVLFLCQLLATIQKILVFQHTYQIIYHLKLSVFNPWIKLPKQTTGLNLIIKLNIFIFISRSRSYFYSKPVKLPRKAVMQLPCEFCCWFCKSLEKLFHHCHFSPEYFKLFCSWGVI